MNHPQSALHFLERPRAFSLVELLVVIAIMGVMAAIAIPVFSGHGPDMTRAADSITDVLQQARTRAMSKNTYVYVGLMPSTGTPPTLTVAVVEAKDGLPSDSNDLTSGGGATNLQSIRRPDFLRGVQLDTTTAGTGLPTLPTPRLNLETSLIRFPANLVSKRGDISSSQFQWVVQFSPDGAARLDAVEPTVPAYILLGLIPLQGNSANAVGLIIDGPSGAVRVVRPGV